MIKNMFTKVRSIFKNISVSRGYAELSLSSGLALLALGVVVIFCWHFYGSLTVGVLVFIVGIFLSIIGALNMKQILYEERKNYEEIRFF